MNTHIHTRHRRLLSIDRRGGIQVSPDAIDGRTSRHALGWRDLQPANDHDVLPLGQRLLLGIVLVAVTWSIVGAAVYVVVKFLDQLGG